MEQDHQGKPLSRLEQIEARLLELRYADPDQDELQRLREEYDQLLIENLNKPSE